MNGVRSARLLTSTRHLAAPDIQLSVEGAISSAVGKEVVAQLWTFIRVALGGFR
jgi:hypothetical protein